MFIKWYMKRYLIALKFNVMIQINNINQLIDIDFTYNIKKYKKSIMEGSYISILK